jgi:glycosyltransferase involved in cell wall biosynthesis
LNVIVDYYTVYNAEQYLQKCLESVFNQDLSLQNYEVICINDGSTDASLSILNKFQEGNTNLMVVSTENKGMLKC